MDYCHDIGWTYRPIVDSDKQLDKLIGVAKLRVLTHQVTRTKVDDTFDIDVIDDRGAHLNPAAKPWSKRNPNQLTSLVLG